MGTGGEIDHYRLLGVSRDASAYEIRRAYRRLARRDHPDVNARPDGAERFAALAHAYETLNDPAERARYDRSLARRVAIAPPTGVRDTPRWTQPASGPIAQCGILELSVDEAQRLARSPLSLIDPRGHTIALPAGLSHGDQIVVRYRGHDVLLTLQIQARS
jgi:curved DNA-binding protein CbpA